MGQRTTLKILLKSARSVMEDQDAPGGSQEILARCPQLWIND